MKNIDDVLQALKENKKMIVPFNVTLKIIGEIERIELREKEKDNGRFRISLQDHDET